jgi:hypothetical protein
LSFESIQDTANFMPSFFDLPSGSNYEKYRNLYQHKIESSSIIKEPADACTEKCAIMHIFLCMINPWRSNCIIFMGSIEHFSDPQAVIMKKNAQ